MINRIEKLSKIRETKKVDAFLITSSPSIKYFSGYFYNFQTGPSPFQLLPAALVVGNNPSLVIADNESGQLSGFKDTEFSIINYESYVFETAIDCTNQFLNRLQEAFEQNGIGNSRIGIEPNSFPFAIAQSLLAQYPGIEFVDVADEIKSLRVVKDIDEIELIRQAAGLADAGQATVLRYAEVGMTELELFSKVRLAMETIAGTRSPMMLDLVCGAVTASGGGNPTNRVIKKNDLVLSDFTPCLNGYWGDSCNTIVVGTPTDEQRKIFSLVRGALDAGISSIRPGVEARSVDLAMRKHLEQEGSFGHHGGHGVGVFYHEEPRIVPYNTMLLEAGMVIALEPAVYKAEYGIRLEHLVAVTETGCEILTKFDHCFEQQ